jgi:hypothetical protein
MKKLIVTLSLILACFSLFAADMDPKILFPDHHLCLEAVGKVVMKADKAEFSFSTTVTDPRYGQLSPVLKIRPANSQHPW